VAGVYLSHDSRFNVGHSTAVGLAVDIVTNWTRQALPYAYLVYDGNQGTVKESATLRNFKATMCPHFSDSDVGDPVLVEL
jgi:molybdopterin-synthase adenylyltransferase